MAGLSSAAHLGVVGRVTVATDPEGIARLARAASGARATMPIMKRIAQLGMLRSVFRTIQRQRRRRAGTGTVVGGDVATRRRVRRRRSRLG